jgi:hypothetical protein
MAKDATLRWTTGGPRCWSLARGDGRGKILSVTSLFATLAQPSLYRYNTVNTFTLSCSFLRRVCAPVLQDTTAAMYITVCYHQPARRGAAGGVAGGAGCCATHITMHFLLSSINQRGADCAAGGGAGTAVCYVYHVYYHQHYRIQLSAGSAREIQKTGGVLLCSSVLRSYVKSCIGGGGCCTTVYYHQ